MGSKLCSRCYESENGIGLLCEAHVQEAIDKATAELVVKQQTANGIWTKLAISLAELVKIANDEMSEFEKSASTMPGYVVPRATFDKAVADAAAMLRERNTARAERDAANESLFDANIHAHAMELQVNQERDRANHSEKLIINLKADLMGLDMQLKWHADRLVNVYNEPEGIDFVSSLRHNAKKINNIVLRTEPVAGQWVPKADYDKAMETIDKLMQPLEKLQGVIANQTDMECAYCRSRVHDAGPMVGWAERNNLLRLHAETCPDHPSRAIEAARDAALNSAAEMEAQANREQGRADSTEKMLMDLRPVIKEAADLFRSYADGHKQRGDTEKMHRNDRAADQLFAALARTDPMTDRWVSKQDFDDLLKRSSNECSRIANERDAAMRHCSVVHTEPLIDAVASAGLTDKDTEGPTGGGGIDHAFTIRRLGILVGTMRRERDAELLRTQSTIRFLEDTKTELMTENREMKKSIGSLIRQREDVANAIKDAHKVVTGVRP